ncbi:MAG: hypothetical protein JSV57_00845 [Candidatus Bathyarchaeota archaeon]|nr:MAG: hypothetical protein JSV57_00845 [Candidatus Bathyarchaeota archaeon]
METQFRKELQARKIKDEDIEFAVKAVREFEEHLERKNIVFESADLEALKDYLSLLVDEGRNSWERLVAIARYCNLAKKNDYYVYFTSILGARNVLPDMGERLAAIAGEETRRKVFQGFTLPPLGLPQENYPRLTQRIMDKMRAELPGDICKKVLTWNYHKLRAEAFKEKKQRFEKAPSIDEYLKDEHERLIAELERCMKAGQLWYEQEITPEVLEFVRDNQEICTGVKHGDKIYVTKMPYAPKQYLKEKDPALKRYHACHCPLVRSAIRDGTHEIPPIFCYCSGGYEKFHFDNIFGEPVEVDLLESALKGDMRCRFANKIPMGKMK